MSSGKKKLAIFFLFLLLLAIPATSYLVFQQQELRSRAVPATTLAFDPASVTKTVGNTFTLNVNVDTGSNSISGAELHIQYDAQKLQALSFAIADTPFLPVLSISGSVGGGFAFIQLLSQPSQPQKGAGMLAKITFKAIAPTEGAPTLVTFTTDTRIAGTGEIGNVLATQPQSAQITIDPISPTGTPTPTPSLIPTPTPKPTGTGGTGGNTNPTPTGNVGIGRTAPTVTPTLKAALGTSTPIAAQPTAGGIPVTADFAPTALITLSGVLLFVGGIAALLLL